MAGNRKSPHLVGSLATIAGIFLLGILTGCGGEAPSSDIPTPTSISSGDGPEIRVTLKDYEFAPQRLKFKVGDTVDFVMTSTDETHTFTVSNLGINWVVAGGQTVREGFTFTQAGEFRLVCVILSHEALGMAGTIVVE